MERNIDHWAGLFLVRIKRCMSIDHTLPDFPFSAFSLAFGFANRTGQWEREDDADHLELNKNICFSNNIFQGQFMLGSIIGRAGQACSNHGHEMFAIMHCLSRSDDNFGLRDIIDHLIHFNVILDILTNFTNICTERGITYRTTTVYSVSARIIINKVCLWFIQFIIVYV